MNHPIVKNTFLFVVLVLLQVLIFNNVAYWGYDLHRLPIGSPL